jgi:hypothetical protein
MTDLLSAILGGHSRGGSLPASVYPLPSVVPGKKWWQQTAGTSLPHPVNDGRAFWLSSILDTGAAIELRAADGTLSHSIAPGDIHASATLFAAFWLDDVNGFLYVLGQDATPGHGYLGKINVTSGAVTAIGSFTGAAQTMPGSPATLSRFTLERASVDAGDFTIQSIAAGVWRCSISSTTGAITVAEAQWLSGGTLPLPIFDAYAGSYRSQDGLLLAAWSQPYIYDGSASNAGAVVIIDVVRGGGQGRLTLSASEMGGWGGVAPYLPAIPWGSSAVMGVGPALVSGPRLVDRASLDLCLNRMASFLGLP